MSLLIEIKMGKEGYRLQIPRVFYICLCLFIQFEHGGIRLFNVLRFFALFCKHMFQGIG